MDDKLTGTDFFAVIGILAIAGIAYVYFKRKDEDKQNAQLIMGQGLIFEEMPIRGVYAPSNVLDGYMSVYDTSQNVTIGDTQMVVLNK